MVLKYSNFAISVLYFQKKMEDTSVFIKEEVGEEKVFSNRSYEDDVLFRFVDTII